MAITSADIRGFSGLGQGIALSSAKDSISEGGRMEGFDDKCIVYAGPVNGSVSGGTITLSRPEGGSGDGVFIRNEDNRVTFGQVTVGGFAASDQFGGCDVTALKAADGTYWSTHVYSSDDCRASVQAVPPGWSVLGTWSSKGYVEKHRDCSGLLVFTFVEDKVKIITVGIGGYPGEVRHIGIAAMFDA